MLFEIHWFKFVFCQITNPHQQVKQIQKFCMLFIFLKAGWLLAYWIEYNILKMYLDAHRYKVVTSLKMPCIVLSMVIPLIFLRNIHSDERLIGTPPKEVLYLYVGITFFFFFCKTSTFFVIKSEELFLIKRNSFENATVQLHRQKNAVLFYASLRNYTLLETNVIS